jgi:drug/metabolite transporter (DMT)-like permease
VPCHIIFTEEITVTGTVFIFIATFFWALDTLIRYPLLAAGLSAIQIVFIEQLLLVMMTSLWLKLQGQSLWAFSRRDIPSLLIIGGLGQAIGTLAFTQAFTYMNPTLVILLQKLQPIVAISLSALILKERIHSGYILCAVLALMGSCLIVAEDIAAFWSAGVWHYSDQLLVRLVGYGLALLAVLSWGASTVFGKRLALTGYSSGQIMHGRFVFGFIVLLPFLFWQMPFAQNPTSLSIAKIVLMVLISGVLGMLFYYQGLKRVQSKQSALAEMAFPVMAGIINWVVLDIALTTTQIVGGLLLIVANLLVHRKVAVNTKDDDGRLGTYA